MNRGHPSLAVKRDPGTAPVDERTEQLIGHFRARGAHGKFVGEAASFRSAISQLPAIARSDASVLITGETGTGKELTARAIHHLSARAPFPFVAVNCGALTETLLYDELFGHERGAFTDAAARRTGLLAAAEQGTLVLDEVEAMTERGQVALLRVLQDRTFRPVGSSREQRADVRFIAVTNAALEPRVRDGTFRADLYYRLSVFSLRLPPLRDRKEDIAVLARYFLEKHAPAGRLAMTLSPSARAILLDHDWPGNVRELENAIIRAVGVSESDIIEPEHLGLPGSSSTTCAGVSGSTYTFKALKKLAVEAFEREYLVRLLEAHGGNVTQAARAASTDRRDLGRLLQKHGLDRRRFSAPVTVEGRG